MLSPVPPAPGARTTAPLVDPRRVAIAFAAYCTFFTLYAPQAVMPMLAREFARSAADTSLIMTASTLSVALTAPFSGTIADYFGRKRVIAVALVLLLVPSTLLAFAPNLDALIVGRFFQGLLLPPIFAVTVAYISDEWPPREAVAVTGIYVSAGALGGFSGRLVTGLVADLLGWRAGFIVNAGVIAGCMIGVVMLLPRERNFVRAASLWASMQQMLRHLGNPRLLATYAVGFGVLFNFIATFTFVTFRLAAPPFHLPASALGAIFTVYLFGSFTASLTGRGVNRLGRRRFVILALAVWFGGLLLTLAPSLPVIVVGLALAAGSGMACQAASTSDVTVNAPEGTSSAVGLYATAYYFGGSLGAFLPGLAWHAAGWPGTVVMVLAMLAAMATIVAIAWTQEMRVTRPAERPPAGDEKPRAGLGLNG
jgi:YNFM family putative membrane transporter